ncbi:hypothetical protein [Sphingomonas aerophila]|uniref:Transcription antitermination factor NusG n=1 Tax=Sphingomonas aerophila TaxID=1344948 RepID=A0A7W9BCM0_9SPHN|nr:hypothetical protein [Sphingomonas aerophila]MBB5714760.1 transcription antitermination factor NusG [Sphingomonas aerophila]
MPITPSFVFVRADRLADLALVLRLPINPHPPFSLFRHGGRVPLIADREIANLRSMEADAADRAQRAARKAHRQAFTPGQEVTCNEAAFIGLTGVVEQSDGKQAVVLFGGALRMTIASWRLTHNPVQEGNKPAMGIAA